MRTPLEQLIDAAEFENRVEAALNWKKKGKKVIGYLCGYVPEEVIYAAGMLPWRILGSTKSSTVRASIYHGEDACQFCHRVLADFLEGQLDFLDGVVTTNSCDDMARLWDIWHDVDKKRFNYIMHLPRDNSELSVKAYQKSICKLIDALESLGRAEIDSDSLKLGIGTYNKMRSILTNLYGMRKSDIPAISGGEALAIVLAAMGLPKDEYIAMLESLANYLQKRTIPGLSHNQKPRLLVSSSIMANTDFIKLVEESGAVVAMDDTCTGSKYFYGLANEALEPTYALAVRYLVNRPPCPRMIQYCQEGLDKVIEWSREYRIDGVLHLPQSFCLPWQFTAPAFIDKLKGEGIPVTTVSRGYAMTNVGQLRTRIEAFIETLTLRR